MLSRLKIPEICISAKAQWAFAEKLQGARTAFFSHSIEDQVVATSIPGINSGYIAIIIHIADTYKSIFTISLSFFFVFSAYHVYSKLYLKHCNYDCPSYEKNAIIKLQYKKSIFLSYTVDTHVCEYKTCLWHHNKICYHIIKHLQAILYAGGLINRASRLITRVMRTCDTCWYNYSFRLYRIRGRLIIAGVSLSQSSCPQLRLIWH